MEDVYKRQDVHRVGVGLVLLGRGLWLRIRGYGGSRGRSGFLWLRFRLIGLGLFLGLLDGLPGFLGRLCGLLFVR